MNNNQSSDFRLVAPRPIVEVHLPDGRVLSGPRNAQIGEFLKILPEFTNPPIVGAVVNGELRELTFPIQIDASVTPVTMSDADGSRIYRRSLTFLLETVFDELFSGVTLTVDHSTPFGGYFCRVSKRPPLSQDELEMLEARMRELVQKNLPFERQIVPLQEAIEFFRSDGEQDKVELLIHRQKNYLTLYRLGVHKDYHHGYMVPSTGYLKWFKLSPAGDGFTLRFPRRHAPTEIQPLPEYPRLLATFRQYDDWLCRLGISTVGALNKVIQQNRIHEVVLVSEALHEQHVSDIAAQIRERSRDLRVVLIAGPSSSGKTTFSKRLAVQLLASGIAPFPLEMDNYFVDRDQTPNDANGKPDFESIRAIDRKLLSDDLRCLIGGQQVQLPHYNFVTGKREIGDLVRLGASEIILLEGIHCLNPDLLREIPAQHTFRIYVSALTQLNLDHYNRVSTTDTRLIRRITRDTSQRGYSAQQTIQRWEAVRQGEKRNIFPYQENADAIFNSALAYELSVLKLIVEPLLRQVPFGNPEYIEAKRLLAFLEWFLPVDAEIIPDNSILREFIGNSILRNFALWHNHTSS
jgi:uridine kinase